jgi:flagellar basal body-associated protein FliL
LLTAIDTNGKRNGTAITISTVIVATIIIAVCTYFLWSWASKRSAGSGICVFLELSVKFFIVWTRELQKRERGTREFEKSHCQETSCIFSKISFGSLIFD